MTFRTDQPGSAVTFVVSWEREIVCTIGEKGWLELIESEPLIPG